MNTIENTKQALTPEGGRVEQAGQAPQAPPKFKFLPDAAIITACGDKGRLWAEAFCQAHSGDVALMTGWFANAIEAGKDVKHRSLTSVRAAEIKAAEERGEARGKGKGETVATDAAIGAGWADRDEAIRWSPIKLAVEIEGGTFAALREHPEGSSAAIMLPSGRILAAYRVMGGNSWRVRIPDRDAPVDSCVGAKAPTITVDEQMFKGLVRAACLYERSGVMVRGDGTLWDDQSRNALDLARKIGLAPPRQEPSWRDGPLKLSRVDEPDVTVTVKEQPEQAGLAMNECGPMVRADLKQAVAQSILLLARERATARDIENVVELVHAYGTLTGP